MTTEQTFASVWDAIEDTPEEAENMKLRSVLMTALKNLGKLGMEEVVAPVVVCVMDRDTTSLGKYQQFTQTLRHRPADLAQPVAGQPPVENAVRVVHLSVAHQMDYRLHG